MHKLGAARPLIRREREWEGQPAISIAGLNRPLRAMILENSMTSCQLFCSAIVMLTMGAGASAEVANPPSESELSEITARGRALSEYDAAAWHAGDAVMALKPTQDTVQRYIARKTDKGWIVAFGRFDAARTKFLIAYEAMQQSAAPTEYEVVKHDPPLADSDIYFRAAKAHELVSKTFLDDEKPQRPYNISVLPAASGDWYVYAIPAQTDLAMLPFGGDVRYTVSADGTKIIEKRQMHKIILEERTGSAQFDFHTHILSDVPEDSDVFYATTRKADKGELLITMKYSYRISADGSLRYLGPTKQVLGWVQEGKYEEIPGSYRPMVLLSGQRLLAGTPAPQLEAFTTTAGARCADGTIWLKFSSMLHNVGDTRIILYKDPLQNSQARFAATEVDMLAGKYEKLAFFTAVKADFSADDSFMMLAPGMLYRQEREYPILDLDLKDKGVVQFLFFTWPLTEEKQEDAQRKRWAQSGFLFTEPIASQPALVSIDRKLLAGCSAR